MVSNISRYCKQINLVDKEMFIRLGRLYNSLVNALTLSVAKLSGKDQCRGSSVFLAHQSSVLV